MASRGRRLGVTAMLLVALALVALALGSGVVSPVLALGPPGGQVGTPDGGGRFVWTVENHGWVDAHVDRLDPGVPGLRGVHVSFHDRDPASTDPSALLPVPARIPAGGAVAAVVSFDGYDCDRLRSSGPHPAAATARGPLPWAVDVDVSAGETAGADGRRWWEDLLTGGCDTARR